MNSSSQGKKITVKSWIIHSKFRVACYWSQLIFVKSMIVNSSSQNAGKCNPPGYSWMLLSEQWSLFFFNTKCTGGILSILLSYYCGDMYISLEQLLFHCSLMKQIWMVTVKWLPRFNSYLLSQRSCVCTVVVYLCYSDWDFLDISW